MTGCAAFFDFFCDRFYAPGILSERNSPFFDIRTGNIDFQHIYGSIRKPLHDRTVIGCALSADIDDNFRIILLQKRNIPPDKYIDPRILQTDCI